jgi:hypothetical protein
MVADKFTREFYSYDYETKTKKLSSRWHYDLKKFANGPILVEELDLDDKKTRKQKKSSKQD